MTRFYYVNGLPVSGIPCLVIQAPKAANDEEFKQ